MINKFFSFLFVLSLSGILLTSCSEKKYEEKTDGDETTTIDLIAIRKIVDEENAAFAKAFISGDSTTMIDHYTADGKLFPPNSEVVVGRNAIAKVVKQYLTYGIKEFKDETLSLYGDGDNIIEEGNLFMGDGKGNTIDKGKYICVWRNVDGKWRVYSDMWNTSLPPATPKK